MGMTKKFVYAKGAGIVFCPDDVLYIIKENFSDLDKETHKEYIMWSSIQFNNDRSINFESKYFDEIQDILVNSKTNKDRIKVIDK